MLVNLKKRIKVKGAWTYAAVPRKNGRFQPERMTEPGTFYIEWRQDGKRKQEPVGDNPRTAMEALLTKQSELNDGATDQTGNDRGPTLQDACEAYLRAIKATRSDSTHRKYTAQVNWLLSNLHKQYVNDVTRDDIMTLFAEGRKQGSNQKTINVRVMVGTAFTSCLSRYSTSASYITSCCVLLVIAA